MKKVTRKAHTKTVNGRVIQVRSSVYMVESDDPNVDVDSIKAFLGMKNESKIPEGELDLSNQHDWDSAYSLVAKADMARKHVETLEKYAHVLDAADRERFDHNTASLDYLGEFFAEHADDPDYFTIVDEHDYAYLVKGNLESATNLFRSYLDVEDCKFTMSHTQEFCGNPKCRTS